MLIRIKGDLLLSILNARIRHQSGQIEDKAKFHNTEMVHDL